MTIPDEVVAAAEIAARDAIQATRYGSLTLNSSEVAAFTRAALEHHISTVTAALIGVVMTEGQAAAINSGCCGGGRTFAVGGAGVAGAYGGHDLGGKDKSVGQLFCSVCNNIGLVKTPSGHFRAFPYLDGYRDHHMPQAWALNAEKTVRHFDRSAAANIMREKAAQERIDQEGFRRGFQACERQHKQRAAEDEASALADGVAAINDQVAQILALLTAQKVRTCRACGCTDDDCRQCIASTGTQCHWVEQDLCSACAVPIADEDARGPVDISDRVEFDRLCGISFAEAAARAHQARRRQGAGAVIGGDRCKDCGIAMGQLSPVDRWQANGESFLCTWCMNPKWRTNMDIGQAVQALKAGKCVAREGWNGKDMWLSYTPGNAALPAVHFWSDANAAFAAAQPNGCARVLPAVTMKTADGAILMGWLASQTDLLADDWRIVELVARQAAPEELPQAG